MAEISLRHDYYLDALARLSPGLAHETRSHLGNVALQVRLLDELLARDAALDDGARARLSAPLERARRGLERLEAVVTRALDARLPAGGQADLDAFVRDLEPLLAPWARERRVEWSVVTPGRPLRIADDGGALREAVVIAAVRLLEGAPAGGLLTARLEADGGGASLAFVGVAPPPEADWLEVVRSALAARRGTTAPGPAGAGLTLCLPLI
jgi:hypothetical protein